ncbi:MAG: hypothetical protein WD066_09880 [Planctomycetaceae bacterium]
MAEHQPLLDEPRAAGEGMRTGEEGMKKGWLGSIRRPSAFQLENGRPANRPQWRATGGDLPGNVYHGGKPLAADRPQPPAAVCAEAAMPNHEELKSLPPNALWEYSKWLGFGQGRHVGVQLMPRVASNEKSHRIRRLAEAIVEAPKSPDDSLLGVTPPRVHQLSGDDRIIMEIARYLADRHSALYADAADFEPRDAIAVQDDVLRRIRHRFDFSFRENPPSN